MAQYPQRDWISERSSGFAVSMAEVNRVRCDSRRYIYSSEQRPMTSAMGSRYRMGASECAIVM